MGSVKLILRYVCSCNNREGIQAATDIDLSAGEEAFVAHARERYRALLAEVASHESAR